MALRAPSTPRRWKQPDEVRLFSFDFTEKLAEGASVSSVVGNALVVPVGITADPPVLNGAVVSALIRGGTDGTMYRVSCLVIASNGETLELDLDLEVLDGAN